MPSIKIYPPAQLPDRNLSDTQFNIWREELEVYLSQEKDFKIFLPGQPYAEWESAESYNDRIRHLNENDINAGERGRNDRQLEEDREEKLSNMRVNLRTVLAIVGKCVSQGHYNTVVRHSTSLNWIYDTLKADYDIQAKGIHFFNILDVKYDQEKHTPVAFYNQYRTIIINNLAKAGDVLKYKNNENLQQDEKMSPMLEDVVLLNVVNLIDQRLPVYIRNHYNHKMNRNERLMDFKTDILINIPSFLNEIENGDTNNAYQEASLNAFKRVSVSVRKYKKSFAFKGKIH